MVDPRLTDQKSDLNREDKPAIVLLSGGLDSATCLAIAVEQGFAVHALTFQYGQRHSIELEGAKRIAARYAVTNHLTVAFDMTRIGGSALTSDIAVPKSRSDREMATGVPVTYVPARNTIFLSFGLAWAEVLGCNDLFIGVNAIDYSGYPDCRPEFIAAYEKLAAVATRAGSERGQRFRIHTPLIEMTKAQIIQRGMELGVDYSLTHSCYDPVAPDRACGKCDACQLRLKGFREAGVADPICYADY